MRLLVIAFTLFMGGCQYGPQWSPTASSGDPREEHVLAETQRFAVMLHEKIKGELTDEIYMTDCGGGIRCPAAGWYHAGTAYYYRPNLLKYDLEYGTQLAAHECCHSKTMNESAANACAALLISGNGISYGKD